MAILEAFLVAAAGVEVLLASGGWSRDAAKQPTGHRTAPTTTPPHKELGGPSGSHAEPVLSKELGDIG